MRIFRRGDNKVGSEQDSQRRLIDDRSLEESCTQIASEEQRRYLDESGASMCCCVRKVCSCGKETLTYDEGFIRCSDAISGPD